MQAFGEVVMSVIGAMILLCIAFGFLGSLFLQVFNPRTKCDHVTAVEKRA